MSGIIGGAGSKSGIIGLIGIETGVWTPLGTNTIQDGGVSTAVGKYTKIGNYVYCAGFLYGSGTGTGNFSGLPYTSLSGTNAQGGGIVHYQNRTGAEVFSVRVQANSKEFSFYVGSTDQFLNNGSSAHFSLYYIAA